MPRRSAPRLALAALLPLALGACGSDATAPEAAPPVLTVALTGVLDGTPSIGLLPDKSPYLVCTVQVGLVAGGVGTGEWTSGVLRWYAGTTRVTPFDTLAVSADEMREAWGAARFAAGQPMTSRWQMAATVPFFGDVVMRYKDVDGREHAATAPFRCGPSVPADAALPQVTSLDIDPPTGALSPGDTVDVTFSATAAASLWRSTVVLSGPCEVRITNVEGLGTNVARQVRVPIPTTCGTDAPFDITVSVVDGAARQATHSLHTTLRLATDDQ
jgi:hypothetical protein